MSKASEEITERTTIGHTPGPWTAGGWSSNGTPVIGSDPHKAHGRTVAIVSPEYRDSLLRGNEAADYELHVTRANIALIEAAPALLAALEATAGKLRDLRAAIVDLDMQRYFIDDGINMMSESQTALDTARAAIRLAKGE